MNDDENNPQPQPWIDPALEARVVALVLGEPSAFEAAELERLLAENPELALFKRRIEATHALVGVAARPENPKIQLSPERRKKLLETIGVPAVVPAKKIRVVGLPHVPWWSTPLLIRVAACLVMTTMVLAIFSSVTLFRSPATPPNFVGYSGESGFVINMSEAQSASGVTLSAGTKPQIPPPVTELTPRTLVSSGVVTAVQPDFTLASEKPKELAKLEPELVNRQRQQLAQAGPEYQEARQLPQSAPSEEAETLVNSVQSELLNPQSQTAASQKANAVSANEYLNGAPDNAPVPSESPAADWDSLYMFRGVNILAEGKSEPIPAEVVDQLAKKTAEIEGPVTAGNRSASAAMSVNPVDALLFGNATGEIAQANQELEAGKDLEFSADKTKSVVGNRQERVAEVQEEAMATAAKSEDISVTRWAEEKSPTSRITVWDGQTSTSGKLIAETTGQPLPTDGRDGTPLPSIADADQNLVAQANEDAVPLFGDIPLAGRVFRDESRPDAPAIFGIKDGKVVQFDGSINYGSPITTGTAPDGNANSVDLVSAPQVTTRSGDRVSTQVVREFQYPTEFQPPSPPSAFKTDASKELTQNVINQPIFSTREDGKVEFDGFINYGSPIATESTLERKVGQTKYLLEEGQEFSESGRYDLAFKRYEQALEIDPYNIEARRGVESINEARAKHADMAYNEAQRNGMKLVDKAWELPVRRFNAGATTIIGQPQVDQTGTVLINRKLDEIVIPRIDFQDVTIREALDFLKQRASTLDESETDPSKKGVNIVLNLPENAVESNARITLGLTDIPLRAAVNYVAIGANLKLKVEPYAVSVVPRSTPTDVLVTKEYKISPELVPALLASNSPLPKSAAGATTAAGSFSAVARSGARDFLETSGVVFPPGATAYFIASTNKLIVKNTQANMELVDTLVENTLHQPTPAPTPAPSAFPTETPTTKKPVSTFSLHVSDVSFQLARDALAKGAMPEPARIRPEEFYNAFDYNDPAPAPGEPVAARIEQAAHPFLQQRNLVRIAVKAAASGRAAGQPLRLTILLDTSGSMEREDRAVSVRQALQTLTTLLGPNDRVTLIGFARTPRLLAEQVPGDQAGKLVEAADRTPSEGGTNLEEALALASEMALKQKLPAAQNRIVLLTDGAANLGNADPVRLSKQIEKTRQQGISFDACGVGAIGLNDAILEALTRKGDGRYYFLNKPEDADASFAKQLAGAFRPAAENVKVQVVFNPARVAKYRLIGFEEHLLKREDFRNDKVQAAELSAEEAGVALYQVEPLPEGEGDLGEVFVRFRDPATGAMVERSWTMPYEANVRAFDQASPSLQLAATAALLAERLQGNTQVDLDALKPVITNLRSHYPHQARVRELLQMIDQVQR